MLNGMAIEGDGRDGVDGYQIIYNVWISGSQLPFVLGSSTVRVDNQRVYMQGFLCV